MGIQLANFVRGTLASSITTSSTTLTLSAAVFPALTGSNYCMAVLQSATNRNTCEIIKVTAVNGTALTVARAQEGTTAMAFNAGDLCELRMTAGALQPALDHKDIVASHVPSIAGTDYNKFLVADSSGVPVWKALTPTTIGAMASDGSITATGTFNLRSVDVDGNLYKHGYGDIVVNDQSGVNARSLHIYDQVGVAYFRSDLNADSDAAGSFIFQGTALNMMGLLYESSSRVYSANYSWGLGASSNAGTNIVGRGSIDRIFANGFFEYNVDAGDTGGPAGFGNFLSLAQTSNATGWAGWAGQLFAATDGKLYWRVNATKNTFAGSAWQQIYTTLYKPSAADVGLGSVNNYGITDSPNTANSSLYASATAVKAVYDIATAKKQRKIVDVAAPAGATAGLYYAVSISGDIDTWDVKVETRSSSASDPMNNCSFVGQVRDGGWSDRGSYAIGAFRIYSTGERAIHSIWATAQNGGNIVFYVEARAFPITVEVPHGCAVVANAGNFSVGASTFNGATATPNGTNVTKLLEPTDSNFYVGFPTNLASSLYVAGGTTLANMSATRIAWGTSYLDAVGPNTMSRWIDSANHLGIFSYASKSACFGSNYFFNGSNWGVSDSAYNAARWEMSHSYSVLAVRPAGGADIDAIRVYSDGSSVFASGMTINNNLNFGAFSTGWRGVYGTMGDNDGWIVRGMAGSTNAGYLEIATGDDGTEPIYVRQYINQMPWGSGGSIARTATLLDGNGNTSFPNTVYSTYLEASSGMRAVLSNFVGWTFNQNRYTDAPFYTNANVALPQSDIFVPLVSTYCSTANVGYAFRVKFGVRSSGGGGWEEKRAGILVQSAESDSHPSYCHEFSANGTFYTGVVRAANRVVVQGYDPGVDGSVACNNWFRSGGQTGWYSVDYGGGVYMVDSTWVRIYGGKQFYVSNTNADAIYTTGGLKADGALYTGGNANVNDVYLRSDIRLKDNFAAITGAMAKVRKLAGWLYDKKPYIGADTHVREAGLIAQDVQAVQPESVYEDPETGILSIAPAGMVALIVEALKDIDARLEALEARAV